MLYSIDQSSAYKITKVLNAHGVFVVLLLKKKCICSFDTFINYRSDFYFFGSNSSECFNVYLCFFFVLLHDYMCFNRERYWKIVQALNEHFCFL